MAVRDIYESGYDEDDGRVLTGRCPECEGRLETESGETACVECGLVVNEYRFDHSSTPRSFDDRQGRTQTGRPLTPSRHDRGLSSEIGYGGDARGDPLSANQRARIARMRTQHQWARFSSRREQNLAAACTQIARLVSALDLSYSLREEASQLYRDASTADLIRGRSIDSMAAGCVYAVCRRRGQNRTLEEIASISHCSVRDVRIAYRALNRELRLDAAPETPRHVIGQVANACGVPQRVERRARELAVLAEDTSIANGRSPRGVAAGCLYYAAQEANYPLRQTDIADAVDVTPFTISARYQELCEATRT